MTEVITTIATPTVSRAAAAVHQLIHRSPLSPSVTEIAAVLDAALWEVVADDALAQEWERAVAEVRDFCSEGARDAGRDAAADRLHDRVTETTLAIWNPELDADFKAHLTPGEYGLDAQSLAQLVNATLKVAGKPHVGALKDGEPGE